MWGAKAGEAAPEVAPEIAAPAAASLAPSLMPRVELPPSAASVATNTASLLSEAELLQRIVSAETQAARLAAQRSEDHEPPTEKKQAASSRRNTERPIAPSPAHRSPGSPSSELRATSRRQQAQLTQADRNPLTQNAISFRNCEFLTFW